MRSIFLSALLLIVLLYNAAFASNLDKIHLNRRSLVDTKEAEEEKLEELDVGETKLGELFVKVSRHRELVTEEEKVKELDVEEMKDQRLRLILTGDKEPVKYGIARNRKPATDEIRDGGLAAEEIRNGQLAAEEIGNDELAAEEIRGSELAAEEIRGSELAAEEANRGDIAPSVCHKKRGRSPRRSAPLCCLFRFSCTRYRSALPPIPPQDMLPGALLENDIALLKRLIASGVDCIFTRITIGGGEYRNAIEASVMFERHEALSMMLDESLKLSSRKNSKIDYSSLCAKLVKMAVKNEKAKCLQVLCDKKLLKWRDEDCFMHYMISNRKSAQIFDILLSEVPGWVEVTNPAGELPIHTAALCGYLYGFLKLYNAAPRTLFQPNGSSRSALQIVIEAGRVDFFEAIYELEMKKTVSPLRLTSKNRPSTMIPLHWAAPNPQSLPILQCLLRNISAFQCAFLDMAGRSPLMYAVMAGNIEACRLLLEHDKRIGAARPDASFPVAKYLMLLVESLSRPRTSGVTIFTLILSYLPPNPFPDFYFKSVVDILIEHSLWDSLDLLLEFMLQLDSNPLQRFPFLSSLPPFKGSIGLIIDYNLKTLLRFGLKQDRIYLTIRAKNDHIGSIAHDFVCFNRLELVHILVEELGPDLINMLDGVGRSVVGLAAEMKRINILRFLLTVPGVSVTKGVVAETISHPDALVLLLNSGATFRSGSPNQLIAMRDHPRILEPFSMWFMAPVEHDRLYQYFAAILHLALESECVIIQAAHAMAMSAVDRELFVKNLRILESRRRKLSTELRKAEFADSKRPAAMLLVELTWNFGPRTARLLQKHNLLESAKPHHLTKTSLIEMAKTYGVELALVEYLFL
jgi:ankyrin repeat protein